MLKNKNIIVVGLQPWDIDIGSNCKDIAKTLSKHNKVVYVNLPLNRKDFIKKNSSRQFQNRNNVLKGREGGLSQINKNLWSFHPKIVFESINWIGSNWLFDYFNKKNAQKLSKEIKRVAEELNFEQFILLNDSDMFRGVYLKELLNPEHYIYYIRDNLICQSYFKKHGERLEKSTIQQADLVTTNSVYLKNYALKHNRHSYYVGQGCDLSLYKPTNCKIPDEILKIEGFKIGYVGYLTEMRLDIGLIFKIAHEKPQWNIVLIGPEDEAFKNSELHALTNIHFLGSKPVAALPSYIQHFDVCFNPQTINEMTIGNYPRKVDEYLAMGKAVVATSTLTMKKVFSKHVYLANNSNEYIGLIKKALEENNEETQKARVAFAHSHSWEQCINEIEKALLKTIKHKDE